MTNMKSNSRKRFRNLKLSKPGDGIGLAHVRTLARRMGGDVTVRSDGKSGSVFTVTVPSDLRAFLNHEPREDRNV